MLECKLTVDSSGCFIFRHQRRWTNQHMSTAPHYGLPPYCLSVLTRSARVCHDNKSQASAILLRSYFGGYVAGCFPGPACACSGVTRLRYCCQSLTCDIACAFRTSFFGLKPTVLLSTTTAKLLENGIVPCLCRTAVSCANQHTCLTAL